MSAATAEPLVDVLSEVDPATDQNQLDNCSLILGDGTVRVDLKNGRARVPVSVARMIRHPHIRVLGLPDDNPDLSDPDENDADTGEAEVNKRPEARGPATQEELDAAREHLLAEGIEPPEVESTQSTELPPPPPGWEEITPEGAARCQAAKTDGGQCSNAAVEGRACALAKHKEQLQS